MKKPALTPKQQRFADEYLIDLNATAAYKRAGYEGKGKSAENAASRLLGNVRVAQYVALKNQKHQEKTGITAERVLEELWGIATADTNELVEYRRICCRHCYGDDHLYQYTDVEMFKAQEADDFDPAGGSGFDPRKPPNKECPECFGEGIGQPHFKDTRNLSPGARALYSGVKVTKDGIQLMLNDKNGALEKLMRHLGMFEKDNNQKTNPVTELLALIAARNTRLPVKS